MNDMFSGASSFNNGGVPLKGSGNSEGWNTSKVTNMSHMFLEVNAFNQDISEFDTSNVTNMSYMFYGASSFNQDISKWNTSKVTNKTEIFNNSSTMEDGNKPIFKD